MSGGLPAGPHTTSYVCPDVRSHLHTSVGKLLGAATCVVSFLVAHVHTELYASHPSIDMIPTQGTRSTGGLRNAVACYLRPAQASLYIIAADTAIKPETRFMQPDNFHISRTSDPRFLGQLRPQFGSAVHSSHSPAALALPFPPWRGNRAERIVVRPGKDASVSQGYGVGGRGNRDDWDDWTFLAADLVGREGRWMSSYRLLCMSWAELVLHVSYGCARKERYTNNSRESIPLSK